MAPAGIAIVQPETGTVPISGLMETVLALATDQVKVILSPNMIEFRLAENELIVGGVVVIAALVVLVVSTVTVTDFVALLLPSSAVNV